MLERELPVISRARQLPSVVACHLKNVTYRQAVAASLRFSGVSINREECALRASKIKMPILILSGMAGIEEKVKGLGFGADDYLTKPFHKDELVARIHAIVRRSKGHARSVITTGDLIVK